MIRIILLTLISYSLISVVIYLISGENEEIAAMFGLGIIGVVLLAISKLTYKIKNMFKYHFLYSFLSAQFLPKKSSR